MNVSKIVYVINGTAPPGCIITDLFFFYFHDTTNNRFSNAFLPAANYG